MSMVTSPVTGAAVTGLTSPTYTLSNDVAPDSNGVQFAVTALGGTQTGVTSHSVASPFTLTFWRPKVLKTLGPVDLTTGVPRGSNELNSFSTITRKGVTPLAGQPARTLVIRTTVEVPAGSDLADVPNLNAAFSAHMGSVFAAANNMAVLAKTGVFS